MALETLYFAFGYVPVMHELRIHVFLQLLHFVVTCPADLPGNFTRSLDRVEVAFPTGYVSVQVRLMVEACDLAPLNGTKL